MLGLVHLVVMAERDCRLNQNMPQADTYFERRRQLRKHSGLVLVLGALLVAGLLSVGGLSA